MSPAFTVTIPGTPIPQGSHRIIRGRIIDDNPTLAQWRESVAWHAKAALPQGWDTGGPFEVVAKFWFDRPRSHLRADGTPLPRWISPWKPTRPDTDKLARAVLDSLTAAGVWGDDGQCARLVAVKAWGDAGLDLTVRSLQKSREE